MSKKEQLNVNSFFTSRKKNKIIYLAGGCFWGVEEYFSRIDGVKDAISGYANGKTNNPRYIDVCKRDTGYAETVKIVFDNSKISLEDLLKEYLKIVDPTSLNKQGNDVGAQYRAGIYYIENQDRNTINNVLVLAQQKYENEIIVEVEALENFCTAEIEHQDYLKKNPDGYCHIDFSSLYNDFKLIDISRYKKTKKLDNLTAEQFNVTQNSGTEAPFDNDFNLNHEKGLYVDIVTGEPLFSSDDKFDSPCGWPSFTKPIVEEVVIYREDKSHGMSRVEVSSRIGDSHLGHVFDDGPEGKLRYCINSASLRFIKFSNIESEGYGYIKNIFKK